MDDNPDLARLFNALDRDAWIELALILGGTFVLIRAEQWALPWLANRLHGRARHYLLASVPLLRLVLIVVALAAPARNRASCLWSQTMTKAPVA